MKLDTYITRQACNIYTVINDNNEGILIDPGYNANNCLIEHLKKLNVDIKYILITHGHYDHIGALNDVLKVYPNAITYIHEEDKICLTSPKYNLSDEFNNGMNVVVKVKHLITLSDNDNLNLLGFSIKVMHTPFHTKGSIIYIFINEEIIFSGDTLFFNTIGRTDLITSEPRKVNDSLLKIKELNANYVIYPGHGIKTNLERELKYNMYLRIL